MEKTKDSLKRLREKYARQLPEKVGRIEKVALGMSAEGMNAEVLDELRGMAHTLGGSSLSFGFSELGTEARGLEKLLKDIIGRGTMDAAERKEIFSAVLRMKHCSTLTGDMDAEEDTPDEASVLPLTVKKDAGKLVYVVDKDDRIRQDVALQLGNFGFEVKDFSTLGDLRAALRQSIPSAILMEVVFPEDNKAGIKAISEIKGSFEGIPVVFMSTREDLDTRIEAVRAGGNAYFIKPVNIGVLTEKLDALTRDTVSTDRYRILIIEDDADLADYYSILLGQAGMNTHVMTNPLSIMAPLVEFNPDLILMDMYMPGCNGLELAKAIRQIESFVSIPIVFLSGETSIEKQLNAMNMGGDDFLTKPIKPEHLISSVCIRAERMRIIRSFMDRDSLTGLLNHTRTKETLDVMLERSKRQGSPLSFAMIDIDKFKSVNDTYGHMTGDRVILSLSRLLRQRLRKTDIIGRYGGEEFAAILADAGPDAAYNIMDGIRESFSRVKHQSEKGEFISTFSCGIASYPDFKDAKALTNIADEALYEAKKSGRNRVATSKP